MKNRFFEYFISHIAKMEKEQALKLAEGILNPVTGQLVWGFIRQQVAERWQNVKERILKLMEVSQEQNSEQHISDSALYIATELLKKEEIPEDIVRIVVCNMSQDAKFCYTVKCWAEKKVHRKNLLMQLPELARTQERSIFKNLVQQLKIL